MPEAVRSLARWAVDMLLLPFRVETLHEADLEGAPDLYYGPDPDRAAKARVGICWQGATWDWFSRRDSRFPAHRFVRIGEARIPVCFEAEGASSFDPVAMTALLLSGWQEVVIRVRDEHGRFPHTASFQHATDSLDVPIVDWMRHIVSDQLTAGGLPLERRQFGAHTWAFCSTHDIDYVRKWRPGIWKRELVDRALLNREGESVATRLVRARRATWSFFESEDPFRAALQRIPAELEARRARGTFFYKAGAHGFRDVAYDVSGFGARMHVIRQLEAGHEVGLHPSYHAWAHADRLLQERDRLAVASGSPIRSHRAHYLRCDHPASMYRWEAAGFLVDSTLGWAGVPGFRHGTCLPFPLFDPVAARQSTVWEVPLTVMESALFNRQHRSADEAIRDTDRLLKVCRDFGGVFVGLWHNTLWDEADYPGWGRHFEETLRAASDRGALMDTLSRTLDAWI
ncbi:MAG: polysaccharide deacetylase family protein [Bacteroidetes bacterium]|nr:polysaccharide deacetylase family protein [Bacteroidota bacterium]